jgi:hypothetical protein
MLRVAAAVLKPTYFKSHDDVDEDDKASPFPKIHQ